MRQCGSANHTVQVFFRWFNVIQKTLQQLIVELRQRVEQLKSRLTSRGLNVLRNRCPNDVLALFSMEVHSLHRDQVNDTFEAALAPDRNLQRYCVGTQLASKLLDDSFRIRTGSVHLVDERNPRNTVTFHLSVNGQRLTLHATDSTKHKNRTVENSQTAFHFNGEVDVSRSIDNVNPMLVPANLRHGR